jgi:hypothetical protein
MQHFNSEDLSPEVQQAYAAFSGSKQVQPQQLQFMYRPIRALLQGWFRDAGVGPQMVMEPTKLVDSTGDEWVVGVETAEQFHLANSAVRSHLQQQRDDKAQPLPLLVPLRLVTDAFQVTKQSEREMKQTREMREMRERGARKRDEREREREMREMRRGGGER